MVKGAYLGYFGPVATHLPIQIWWVSFGSGTVWAAFVRTPKMANFESKKGPKCFCLEKYVWALWDVKRSMFELF